MPVKFYLHPKVNKKGEAPITISINIRQTRLLTTLGYSVDPAAWEESVNRFRPKFKVLDKPVIFLTKEEHSFASPYPTESLHKS